MSTRAMRASRVPLKREATHFEGLATPNESMSTPGTPPKEEEDDDKGRLSNILEAALFMSNDGLPRDNVSVEVDEGYGTQGAERKVRSASPSLESRPGSFRQPTVAAESVAPLPSVLPRPSMAPSLVPSIAPMIGASLEIVGKEVNLLVEAIEELRQLGLKEIETELPELVLVGDQSAGKSSLMSAIAEINLPKNTGMCTRCPMNIRTAPAAEWKCIVSLHETYRFSTDTRRKPTRSNPFPPWTLKEQARPTIHPFAETNNKAELENILRWAQRALLNPNQHYTAFIPGTGSLAKEGSANGIKDEADFSPNLVSIEIFGPRLPALSFYDLPGIVANAEADETDYLITVFENLTKKYINHKNALIICAVTMSNDAGNSRTTAIIGQLKARPRTIGVLTMPDRLQGTHHMDYNSMLNGKTRVLPRGYFVTKQPGHDFQPGNGDYHIKARKDEDEFFDNDPRWPDEWREHRGRCGTKAIQTYLSQQFARMIANSMPTINQKITEQAESVDEKLRQLPELPHQNVQHVVRQCLQQFSNDVSSLLQGGVNSNDFLSEWSTISMNFGQIIQKIKPTFVFTDPSDQPRPEVIDLDGSDADTVVSTQSNRKRLNEFDSPIGKRPHFNDSPIPLGRGFFGGERSRPKEEATSPASSITYRNFTPGRNQKSSVFDTYISLNKRFKTIRQVRSIIAKHQRPGHPENVTDAAREELCLESLKAWKGPRDTLASATFSKLRSAVLGALNRCLGNYRQTDLYKRSKRHLEEWLRMHYKEQEVYLESFLELEQYKLFTINSDAFKQYKAEELPILQSRRRDYRAKICAENQARSEGKSNDGARIKSILKGITDEQLGTDPFAQEIDLAAYVRGYYRTAGLRFADNLCQNIQGMLFRRVEQQIPFLLEGLLGINGADSETVCRNLMVEDHGEAAARAALQDEKKKLQTAADRLEQLVRELGITPIEQGPQYQDEDEEEDDDVEDEEMPLRSRQSPSHAEASPFNSFGGRA